MDTKDINLFHLLEILGHIWDILFLAYGNTPSKISIYKLAFIIFCFTV